MRLQKGRCATGHAGYAGHAGHGESAQLSPFGECQPTCGATTPIQQSKGSKGCWDGGGGTVPIHGSQVVILSPEHPRLVELFALYSCASNPRMNQM
jgi:hypothetical protein